MSEKGNQNAILAAFGGRPYIRLWRANVGVARPLRSERVIRFGVKGQADLSGILACGKRLEIECKAGGETIVVGSEQDRWRSMVRRFNGLHVEAVTVADVEAALAPHVAGCSWCYHAKPWAAGGDPC